MRVLEVAAMKVRGQKWVALIGLAAVVGVAGLIITASKAQQQQVSGEEPRRGTIAWHVKQAKSRGRKKAVLDPVLEHTAVVRSLEDALSLFTVVVAQPVEKRSYIADGESLVTWNKLKVLEVISRPAKSNCPDCLAGLAAPPDMLPLKAGEILIPTNGGSVVVDGVELVSQDRDLGRHLLLAQKYLLFLSMDESKGTGKLELGQYSVFTIGPDGTIQSIGSGNTPLRRAVETRSGGSLNLLRDLSQKKQ